jgi:uncharacterized Fe-S radical SAM superfamily protein PflX
VYAVIGCGVATSRALSFLFGSFSFVNGSLKKKNIISKCVLHLFGEKMKSQEINKKIEEIRAIATCNCKWQNKLMEMNNEAVDDMQICCIVCCDCQVDRYVEEWCEE